MKFHAFHLMPYRHLDMAEADKYRSYWSVLPNRLYDPEKGADLYQEYIGQLVQAAELGFDGVCVNEHHQTAYGLMPAPNLIASILIDRTRGMNTRIPIIGRALPLLNNPLTVAEEYAMLDALSHGRIVAGFVRGIGCE
jgi:alkanesulfonate monooxygenase SsuD/methylene tetrahydromethanopterin reductase-like flavin-dependent oxidoreductase (luciferase family)